MHAVIVKDIIHFPSVPIQASVVQTLMLHTGNRNHICRSIIPSYEISVVCCYRGNSKMSHYTNLISFSFYLFLIIQCLQA